MESVTDKKLFESLDYAISFDNIGFLQRLLNDNPQRANTILNFKSLLSETARHYKYSSDVMQLLLTHMSQEAIEHANSVGRTALHTACNRGHQEKIIALLNRMSVEAVSRVDFRKCTALSNLLSPRTYPIRDVVELILAKMTTESLDAKDVNHKSVLDYAIENHPTTIDLFCQKMSLTTLVCTLTKFEQYSLRARELLGDCTELLMFLGLPDHVCMVIYEFLLDGLTRREISVLLTKKRKTLA